MRRTGRDDTPALRTRGAFHYFWPDRLMQRASAASERRQISQCCNHKGCQQPREHTEADL